MKRHRWVLALILTCGLANLSVPAAGNSTDTAARTVTGTVVAVNTTVDPRTIVVKVVLPTKEELIVGARVSAGTRIARRQLVAGLTEVKVGETATLTYLKARDGLIAQSIQLR